MKQSAKAWIGALILAWGIPWLLVGLLGESPQSPSGETTAPTSETRQQEPVAPEPVTIRVLHRGQERELPLSEYLTGVLLGEIPGSFPMAAKEAQAVAARTYALRTALWGGKHPGAVCTDSGCCQSWADPEQFTGTDTLAQAREAVENTRELVVCYEGELIEATYFSCSGGRTEAAVAVWGAEIPYLQSVESPGEEEARWFREEKFFTREEFARALGVEEPLELEELSRTEGGGVAYLRINGQRFTGTRLRELLLLRSAAFTLGFTEEGVTVETSGFGHRVGLSQYGARAMALEGADFRQILAHYYPGTTLEVWEGKNG